MDDVLAALSPLLPDDAEVLAFPLSFWQPDDDVAGTLATCIGPWIAEVAKDDAGEVQRNCKALEIDRRPGVVLLVSTGLAKSFDPEKHPRGSDGRWAEVMSPITVPKAAQFASLDVAAAEAVAATRSLPRSRPRAVDGDVYRMLEATSPVLAKQSAHWAMEWQVMPRTAQFAVADLKDPDSWASAQYHATQACLERDMERYRAEGVIDDDGLVQLYRGIGPDQADSVRAQIDIETGSVEVPVRPLSGWTPDYEVAHEFGEYGLVISQKIHSSRIFAAAESQSGAHWSREKEWIVITDGAAGTVHAKVIHGQSQHPDSLPPPGEPDAEGD